jgi:hypothetical protein
MPIILDIPDPSITSMFRSGLREWVTLDATDPHHLLYSEAKPLGMLMPHKVYALSTGPAGDPVLLDDPKLVGWRYLIEVGADVVASIQSRADSASDVGRVSRFTEGPNNTTYEAFNIVKKLPELQRGDYVLQLLDVPALGVRALWLRHSDDDRNRDFYVPLRRAWPPLIANTLMRRDAFEQALGEMKKERNQHRAAPP